MKPKAKSWARPWIVKVVFYIPIFIINIFRLHRFTMQDINDTIDTLDFTKDK